LCVSFDLVDHGSRWGYTVQALNQLRHPVALSEALDVLLRAMRPTLYHCIAIAIKIASSLPAFFVAIDLLFPTTITK